MRRGATSTASNRMWLFGVVRMLGEPGRCRRRDPPLLPRQKRFGRIIEPAARLDLDENQEPAAPRHDVDLADRAPETARHDAKALGDQIGGGAAFGRKADAKRRDALRPRRAGVVIRASSLPSLSASARW